MSVSDICRKLEAQGYKTVRGKLSRKAVAYVLDSDLYIGRRTVPGQFTEDGQDKIIENDHEPIVSEELNAKVKARRTVELKKQEQRVAAWRKQREEKINAASDGHPGNDEPIFIDAD